MKLSVSEAKAQLTELVRRAEARGAVVRLVPVKPVADRRSRCALREAVRASRLVGAKWTKTWSA
ncbi:MAG: hypothetical protein M0T84_04905 [Betaproteobacteria bacterium]|nr:hypothetical protein [Betaproteobacteria bacterium]